MPYSQPRTALLVPHFASELRCERNGGINPRLQNGPNFFKLGCRQTSQHRRLKQPNSSNENRLCSLCFALLLQNLVSPPEMFKILYFSGPSIVGDHSSASFESQSPLRLNNVLVANGQAEVATVQVSPPR
jgi:hypothetical protein